MVWLRTKNRTILQEGNFKAELPESSVINLIGLHLFLNQVIDKADGFFQAVGKGMNFGSFSGAEVLQENTINDRKFLIAVGVAGSHPIEHPVCSVHFHIGDGLFGAAAAGRFHRDILL